MKAHRTFAKPKQKIFNYCIIYIILVITVTGVVFIYKSATKIDYPWYFESLKVIENRSESKDKTIGIAIIDSGFKSGMKQYFNNEIIYYNATDDENAEDMTGHGTQMALLIASNSKQKKSIYGINANVQVYSIKVCTSLGMTTTQYLHNALIVKILMLK